jgi:hypothetical protein
MLRGLEPLCTTALEGATRIADVSPRPSESTIVPELLEQRNRLTHELEKLVDVGFAIRSEAEISKLCQGTELESSIR